MLPVLTSNKFRHAHLHLQSSPPILTDNKLPRPAEFLNRRKLRSNLPVYLPAKEGQKQEAYEKIKDTSSIMTEVQKTNKYYSFKAT